MSSLIPLPASLPGFLNPYLPHSNDIPNDHPFVTLTYAQSLDSKISIQPGVQTAISHLETKTMTHYLRSKHESILVGIGTVLADDPGLNCRYGDHKITPIILDPSFKFFKKIDSSRMLKTLKEGKGPAPVIIVSDKLELIDKDLKYLTDLGVKVVQLPSRDGVISWNEILKAIRKQGFTSVMVEGGARIINDLLLAKSGDKGGAPLIDSLIITIGAVFLGSNGVDVSPAEKVSLKEITWWTGVKDGVLAAKVDH